MSSRSRVVWVLAASIALVTGAWWSLRGTDSVTGAGAVAAPSARPQVDHLGPGDQAGIESRAPLVEPRREISPASPDPAAAAGPERSAARGRVQDTAGARVAGIQVLRVDPRAPARDALPVAVTNAAGEFVWSDVTWAELVAESAELTTVLPIYASSAERAIVVAPRRDYAGVVVDERGQPLAGVRLDAQMTPEAARALLPGEQRASARRWASQSAADGAFELTGVGWTEGLAVELSLEGFTPGSERLPEHSSAALVLVLRRPVADPRAIVGRVVDEAGEAVQGATVAFVNGEPAYSGPDGAFVAPIPDGARSSTLWAIKAGHLPAALVLDDLAADPPPPRGPVTLVLGGPPPSIAGVVLDRDGAPLEHAHVFTWDMEVLGRARFVESVLTEDSFAGRTESDAQGRFCMAGLLAKPYRLFALHPRTLEVVDGGEVEAGRQDVVLRFAASETPRRVAGRVVDGRGEPVAGALVFCGRDASPGLQSLLSPLVVHATPQTDADGAFEFPALCVEGTYLLIAGEDIAQQARWRLEGARDLEHLTITVSRVCRFQVVLADPEEADAFYLLDETGARLPLGFELGDVMVSGSGAFDLAGGRSEVMRGDERTHTLVLQKRGAEVRRAPLRLVPGKLQLVSP